MIGPFADIEFVLYSKVSHWFWEYDNFSGILFKEKLKVVDPTPKILRFKSESYALFVNNISE